MFDIKLVNGEYFKNVDVYDTSIKGFIEGMDGSIEYILDNADYKMKIYHANDDNCEDLLAEIVSNDIEYICKAYRYEKGDK